MRINALSGRRGLWLALGIGLIGLWVGRRFSLPGGAFTGVMIITGLANLWLGTLEDAPRWLQTVARAGLGVSIGASVTSETVQAIARAVLPVSLMVVSVTLLGIAAAWAISRYTDMKLPTALCGASPGALPVMVTLSEDLGGETPVVATMHLIRLISILLIVPTLITVSFSTGEPGVSPVAAEALISSSSPLPPLVSLGLLLLAGLAAAIVARRINMPAGDILAPMIVAGLINPSWLHVAAYPEGLRLFSLWIIGIGVGVSVKMETLRHFRPFAIAGSLMTAFLISSGLGLGALLSWITDIDLLTAVLGCAPGGATALIILAGELGADAQLVAAMHVTRMIILMVLLPILIRGAARRLALRTAVSSPPA